MARSLWLAHGGDGHRLVDLLPELPALYCRRWRRRLPVPLIPISRHVGSASKKELSRPRSHRRKLDTALSAGNRRRAGLVGDDDGRQASIASIVTSPELSSIGWSEGVGAESP
jgi:hypothetical protein